MRDLDRLLQQAAADGRQAARPLSPGDVRGIGATMRRVRSLAGTSVAALTLTGVVLLGTTVSAPDATLPAEPQPPLPGPTSSGPTPPVPTPTDEVSSPPATSPTPPPPTSSPSTEPTPTDPAPLPEPILAGNLLGADDFEPVGVGGNEWTWVESARPLPRCTPGVSEAAVETGTVRFEVTENPFYTVAQHAEAYASDADAAARLADLRAEIGQCAEESADVNLFAAFTLTGVGDAGFIVESQEPDEGLLDVPPANTSDVSLYATTRFAQTGRVVTWTVWTVGKAEYLNYPEVGDLGPAVDRLCGPAEGSCTGEAGLTITYPTEYAGTEVQPGGDSSLI